jgi:hypothetical protein
MSTSNDDVVQKVVRLDRRDVEKFDELFPQQGAWTWFIRGCLEAALRYHDEPAESALDNIVSSYLHKHYPKDSK